MINFIICEDNNVINKNIQKIITKVMMPINDEYKIHSFSDCTDKLKELINKEIGSKIYILDIEILSSTGIDIARNIRDKDWDSLIIILTAHYELKQEVLQNRLMLLDFISKFNNYEEKLKEVLDLSLKIYNSKRMINFTSNYVTYRINTSDILYILRDSVSRKTIIKTLYSEYETIKTIAELKKNLDKRFFQTHRSAIINVDHIRDIDYKNEIITFKNEETIDFLSRNNKKGLKEYVRDYL